MNGLLQIRDAVILALQKAGLTAIAAYPAEAKRYSGTVAAVDVASAATRGAGFGCYLGQRYDETTGSVLELYGRQIDVEILLEIRGTVAESCERGMETAAETLLEALPSGLRPGELSWEPVCWDADNRLFLRRGKLNCRAFFTAEQKQEEDALLDFILKGVMNA